MISALVIAIGYAALVATCGWFGVGAIFLHVTIMAVAGRKLK